MSRAWGLLTVDESERNHSGNAGNGDVLGTCYIWDGNVPSHKEVSEGDLVVLRDGKYVLGLARIDTITVRPGSKDRFRCPRCTSTKFTTRAKKSPQHRCDKCKFEFDSPDVEHLDELMFYEADYERTWQPLDVVMPKQILERAFLGGAKQNGIRELNFAHARQIIEAVQPLGDLWWTSNTGTKVRLPVIGDTSH